MSKTFFMGMVLLEAKVERWSEWSNFHVTYLTPPFCKIPFPYWTVINYVKHNVIYAIIVSV